MIKLLLLITCTLAVKYSYFEHNLSIISFDIPLKQQVVTLTVLVQKERAI